MSAAQPAPVDRLAVQYDAWRNGIDLGPSEPRIRELIERGYREILEVATYLGNATECATIRGRLLEMGVAP